MVKVTQERQLADFLPEGKYFGVEDPVLRNELKHSHITNPLREERYADLDFSQFERLLELFGGPTLTTLPPLSGLIPCIEDFLPANGLADQSIPMSLILMQRLTRRKSCMLQVMQKKVGLLNWTTGSSVSSFSSWGRIVAVLLTTRMTFSLVRNSSIFNKRLDDPTQLILMFEVMDLVGIVSLLCGLLLHSAAPSHRDLAPCELLVRTLAIIRALGEEGMWLEFRHMASYLILYSSHHLCEDLLHMASYLILYSSYDLCEDLLHQVILCLGYFTVLQPDNQRPPPHRCSLPRPHLMLIQPPLQQTHPRTGAKLCAPPQLRGASEQYFKVAL
ncbi:hypothetical protein ACOMHN_015855 [Nucella lapillus]